MVRSFRMSIVIAALCAASGCTQFSATRASFAPDNMSSSFDRAGASQLVESPFRGVPSTGSELSSPSIIPGSPSTALR